VLTGTRDSIRTTLRLDALAMNDDGGCKLFYVGQSIASCRFIPKCKLFSKKIKGHWSTCQPVGTE